jgi:hypothetical protein
MIWDSILPEQLQTTWKKLASFQRRKYNQTLDPPPDNTQYRGIKADLAVTAQDIKDMELPAHSHKLEGK